MSVNRQQNAICGKQHLRSHGIKLLVDFLDVLQISDELPHHTAIQLAEDLTTLQQQDTMIRESGSTGSTQELQGSSSRSTPCLPCLKIRLLEPSSHCKAEPELTGNCFL